MRYTTFVKQAELIEERLKTLSNQVTVIQQQEILTPSNIEKLKLIDSTALSKNNEFEKIVNKLFSTSPLPDELDKTENMKAVSSLQDKIGDLYMTIHTLFTTLIPVPELEPSLNDSINSQGQATPSNRPVNVHLPTLHLGTFSGQSENWITFRNIFESSIHKVDSIPNVQKMSYLLSCLEGDALSVIKALPITNANYCIAWEALNKRYHNTRLLVSLHINNILDLPTFHNTPSVKQLRHFATVLSENIQALKALDYDISQESLILTSHLLRKFDVEFCRTFEQNRSDCSLPPKLDELIKHIDTHCAQLEAANLSKVDLVHKFNANKTQTHKSPKFGKHTTLLTSSHRCCTFCNSSEHAIYSCQNFSKLSVQERFYFVKDKRLCKNCLGDKHKTNECKSARTCQTCKKRHHSLLHFTENMPLTKSIEPQVNNLQINDSTNCCVNRPDSIYGKPPNMSDDFVGLTNSNKCQANTVLLATVLVLVKTDDGKSLTCRAILDSAAQSTFITEKCAQSLGLKRSNSYDMVVNGISSSQVKTKGLSYINLSSLSGDVLAKHHPVFILDKITHNMPRAKISQEVRLQMKHLVLADPTYDSPAPIDLLLNAEIFALSVKRQVISLGKNMPTAMETSFGYALFGSAPILKNYETCNNLVTLLTTNLDLHSSIQKFWTLEEPPDVVKVRRTPAEEDCEQHFLSTHSRTNHGRYVVSLPFSDNPNKLGVSSSLALKLLSSLENKFRYNPNFKKLYVQFMQDLLASGHMALCNSPPTQNTLHYYLPHHGVLREGKLRVVFNASAPTSTSISLNSILHSGPKLHNNICDIIINFRRHPVVFTCDIRQMFRQIMLQESDQQFQLVFWRENESQPLQTYVLKTVTYGITSSPYLANRVIQQLILDEGSAHPLAASALKNLIYVDDALLGANSIEEACFLKADVIQLLKKGGFELRKWSSNHPSLLEDLPEEHKDTPIGFLSSEQPVHSVLGLKWSPFSDVFSYSVKLENFPTVPTKRSVLSSISQIYDPVGWLTPVTFWAKSLMQHLWTLGLKWDEPLSGDLICVWNKFQSEMCHIKEIKISRHTLITKATNIQLHGFSDASEMGYAGCVYLRIVDHHKNIYVHLLIAKSKVAPLKRMTLPRLELCGAHLLSKLLLYCVKQLSAYSTIDSVTAWTDSSIVLSWIRTPLYRLKVFVANRVNEIQENVPPSFWSHVSSADNPADCASRGISPSALNLHPLWWNGPTWLRCSPEQWPESKFKLICEDTLPDTKTHSTITLAATENEPFNLIFMFSTWSKLVHVTTYMLRFVHNLKHKIKLVGGLKLQEIENATLLICRLVQLECFSNEALLLKRKQPVSLRIRRLHPYLDDMEIIRVGGRLSYSALPISTKHPILLPKDHHIVNILIDYYHTMYLHSGPSLVQTMLASKFWILSARSVIRSRIFKCIRCFKCKPPSSVPLMGNLPASRVTPSRPFSVSGVDFAGPFFVKQHLLKRVQPMKVYLCIFICFSTKAVHLEVVTDLTADAYLASLSRFTARRGIITDLYSDNGTNFTGASEKLKRIFQSLLKDQKIAYYAEKFKIKFHFIPPHSPHQGGLWERAVQSAKHHLTRVIGKQVLTLEEFITLATRTEAILNSRPITPLSSDPSDIEALTPGHFIAGGPLMTPLESDLTNLPLNRLNRWQMVQSFAQHLWRRWQKEYLHTLQQRSKWTTHKKNIEVNDLVIIHEDNTPPITWKLGRVISLSPGLDGVVRVLNLKTATGNLTRPVKKVSVLPIETQI